MKVFECVETSLPGTPGQKQIPNDDIIGLLLAGDYPTRVFLNEMDVWIAKNAPVVRLEVLPRKLQHERR